jgi:hypothetical protein
MDLPQVISELQSRVGKGRADIVRYQDLIAKAHDSIRDAEVTLRTLQSMGVAASEAKPLATTARAAKSSSTIPEMIFAVMGAQDTDPDGYDATSVIELISKRFGIAPDPNNVRPTLWRMNKEGRLQKSEAGRYRLPSNEKPADTATVESLSAGRFETPAQGREAGPGGGA